MLMPKEAICATTVNNVFCLKYTLENFSYISFTHSHKTGFCNGEKLLGPNRGVNALLFVRTLNLSLNSLPLDKWILELRTVLDIHVHVLLSKISVLVSVLAHSCFNSYAPKLVLFLN